MTKPNKVQTAAPKFEVALQELELIVEEMETAELPLEKLIERYERGIQLVKLCGEKLSEAEQKIEVLTKAQSEIGESKPEKPRKNAKNGDDEDSEVSLF